VSQKIWELFIITDFRTSNPLRQEVIKKSGSRMDRREKEKIKEEEMEVERRERKNK
jgi:hypothetical protein